MQRDSFVVGRFPSLERFQSEFRGKTIRVLIATEEIIGPVRNGGIASTYYHLARGLARQGHKVTVLYLKGRKVENETPEHWIVHFAQFGIELVYLDYFDQPVVAASERWQRTYYSFYLWLKKNDRFDVIHTSEWRGGAFYCLQAKRLGLAFENAFFIVKTSSPHIWNRHYQMQPMDESDMMAGSFAEQKCVEWADMVVGGSAHLLTFMKQIGYALPEDRTYVQPNIIDFSEVQVTDLRPARKIGDIVRTSELVFFGRLEPRKGLDLFVNALNLLAARGIYPSRVNFLGKEGERMLNHGAVKPLEFIAQNAKAWPFAIEVITDRNQPEALSFMCQRDMIAVMPSLIENSTMAVYEALVHQIPFIATAVGGTPELIGEAYHDACLIPPGAEELANRLATVLERGHVIAAPAFDNEKNLETWYAFHRFVAEHGTRSLVQDHGQATVPARPAARGSVSYLAFSSSAPDLARLLENLKTGPEFDEIIVATSFPLPEVMRRSPASSGRAAVVECIGLSVGEAFNRLRTLARSDILVFNAAGLVELDPRFVDDIRRALGARPDSICTTAVRFPEDANDPDCGSQPEYLLLPIGDIASQYATGCAYGIELIALRAATLSSIGAFEPYNVGSGIVHEYVSRAMLKGIPLEVIPEACVRSVAPARPWVSPTPNYEYLKSKSLIDSAPLPVKKILLYHLGQGGRGKIRRTPRRFIANAGRAAQEVAWLTNARGAAGSAPRDIKPDMLLLGFDASASRVRLGLPGAGSLRVFANKAVIIDRDHIGAPGAISVTVFDVLPLLEHAERVWLNIEFHCGDRHYERTLALQKFEDNIHFISSGRQPIFWGKEFDAAVAVLGSRAAAKPAATGSAGRVPARALLLQPKRVRPRTILPPKTRPEPPGTELIAAATDEQVATLAAEARKLMADFRESASSKRGNSPSSPFRKQLQIREQPRSVRPEVEHGSGEMGDPGAVRADFDSLAVGARDL